MIKINLLPLEKRKAERTPLPRMMLLGSTVAAAGLMVVVNLFVWFRILGVEGDIEDQTQTFERLKPRVAEWERVSAERERLRTKKRELDQVITRPPDPDMWRAVNAIWDVVHANTKVWLDDIKILDERAVQGEVRRIDPESKDAPGFGVVIRCHVAGNDVADMTKFRNALKDHPVLLEVLPGINFNPDWRVEAELESEEKWSIAFAVSLFGPSGPPKPRAKPAPAAAPVGGAR